MRPRKSLRNAIYRLLDKHPGLWSLFRVLPTANSRIRVLKKLPRSGRGAEIGVWKGGGVFVANLPPRCAREAVSCRSVGFQPAGLLKQTTNIRYVADMDMVSFMHRFSTDEVCLAFLERVRWPDGPVCPKCGSVGRATHLRSRPGTWSC
jgi:hypothetical protein